MLDTFKHKGQRERLIEALEARGIADERILKAMGKIPRHLFVESVFHSEAYHDKALPIARGQTISQPLTVALQTELLRLKSKMKVLEIGTGSGYQAAVLCEMGMRVFSVEIDRTLHLEARERLENLGYKLKLHYGDGSLGWDTYQPYERILVTAASPSVPETLQRQLEVGGIMVIPVGNRKFQRMTVVTRLSRSEFEVETLHKFKFVPLRGRFGFQDQDSSG